MSCVFDGYIASARLEMNGDATILACTVDRREGIGCLVLSNDETGEAGLTSAIRRVKGVKRGQSTA